MPSLLPLPGPTLMSGADGLDLEPRIYVMISRICTPLPILMCAGMRGKLPDVVKLPPSVTVPFSSFEEALKQPENKDMAQRLEAAVKAIPSTSAEEKLRECRDIVMEVRLHMGRERERERSPAYSVSPDTNSTEHAARAGQSCILLCWMEGKKCIAKLSAFHRGTGKGYMELVRGTGSAAQGTASEHCREPAGEHSAEAGGAAEGRHAGGRHPRS